MEANLEALYISVNSLYDETQRLLHFLDDPDTRFYSQDYDEITLPAGFDTRQYTDHIRSLKDYAFTQLESPEHMLIREKLVELPDLALSDFDMYDNSVAGTIWEMLFRSFIPVDKLSELKQKLRDSLRTLGSAQTLVLAAKS